MNAEQTPGEMSLASLILPLYLPTLCIMFGYGMIVPVLPLFARSLTAAAKGEKILAAMAERGITIPDPSEQKLGLKIYESLNHMEPELLAEHFIRAAG